LNTVSRILKVQYFQQDIISTLLCALFLGTAFLDARRLKRSTNRS